MKRFGACLLVAFFVSGLSLVNAAEPIKIGAFFSPVRTRGQYWDSN